MSIKVASVALLALLVSFSNARCQSTFVFDNRNRVDAPIFDWQGNALSGSDYLAELYGSASMDSLAPTITVDLMLRVILPFRTGTNAGYVAGTPVMMVVDTLPGAPAWLQVRAWEARLGDTYENVAALGIGGYGESPVFYADGGNPFDQFPFPGPLVGLESFSLRPIIPEPSTSALFALGSVVIWMVRQRRHTCNRGDKL